MITSKQHRFIVPTQRRLWGSILVFLVLIVWTRFRDQIVFTDPTRVHKLQSINPEPTPDSEPAPHLESTLNVVDDVEDFFVPNHITPAVWGKPYSNTRCAEDWAYMYAYLTSSNFSNWETAYVNSSCHIYPIPKGGLIFHVHWAGNWRPFNEYLIEAWLATQRLEHGHRLLYWYEDEGPPEDVRQRFNKYSDYVEFRKLDSANEGIGYCITDMPEWNKLRLSKEHDGDIQTLNDIVRYLLLAKYGGVWLDADMIPLRDLTPMLRVGPSASSVSQSFMFSFENRVADLYGMKIWKKDWNTNLLVFGPPGTRLADVVLQNLCSISAGKDILQSCEDELNCGISRIPVQFTDGFKHTQAPQVKMGPCEPGEYNYSKGMRLPINLFTLFTWHSRLAQFHDGCVDFDRPTVAGAVRRRIRQYLNSGLEMGGRDLYPGPAFIS
jgi:hypothetical protein